jgi:hypothetical protein
MNCYGLLISGYTGHLNPMTVLGRELQRRGHRVVVVAPIDSRDRVRESGLEFQPVATAEFPPGAWEKSTARLGELSGMRASRYVGHWLGQLARGIQRDLPGIAAREKLGGLVMDQICLGTEGVCAALGLPLAVACRGGTWLKSTTWEDARAALPASSACQEATTAGLRNRPGNGLLMIILYYFTLIAPFMALFAVGYQPVVWLGRMFMKRRIVEAADAWAALAGTAGTVVGFLFFGLTNLDRFALAPDFVRAEWQGSGSAFLYELLQSLFSGAVSALVLMLLARFRPCLCQNARLANALVALAVSFVTFSLWPVLCAPFL